MHNVLKLQWLLSLSSSCDTGSSTHVMNIVPSELVKDQTLDVDVCTGWSPVAPQAARTSVMGHHSSLSLLRCQTVVLSSCDLWSSFTLNSQADLKSKRKRERKLVVLQKAPNSSFFFCCLKAAAQILESFSVKRNKSPKIWDRALWIAKCTHSCCHGPSK